MCFFMLNCYVLRVWHVTLAVCFFYFSSPTGQQIFTPTLIQSPLPYLLSIENPKTDQQHIHFPQIFASNNNPNTPHHQTHMSNNDHHSSYVVKTSENTKNTTKSSSQRRTVRVRKKNMDKKAAWTLEQMAEGVNSEDTDVQLTATVKLRQCISRQDIGDGSLTLDVQRIIDLKLVPRLIHLLSFGTHPKLVYETCWVLTNICKETFPQTKTVVDAGVIPVLVTKFRTADHELKGQLAWLVGNIAAECVNFRKQFVEVGIVPLLSEFIATSFDKKMLGKF